MLSEKTKCACEMSGQNTVSIWSASYSLEKNSYSGGGVTSFTNRA